MRIYNISIVFYLICLFLISCNGIIKQKTVLSIEKLNTFPNTGDTLLIVIDTKDSMSFKREEKIGEKTIFHYRKHFNENPNLIVNIGNNYTTHNRIVIKSEKLNNYPILYDSNTTFNTWSNQNYVHYFLIEKDALFNSSSGSLGFLEVSMSTKGEI
jgi:hypothetical protein